jgi:hypothetical protein
MKNAPKGKYSGVVQEEGLSQEGRKKLEGIKAQVFRIDKLLEKVK